MSAVEDYITLGLRLGRHVDGIVDAYYGPPELAAAVAAEEPREPAHLAIDADAFLAELAASGLAEQRCGWLEDQLAALRTYAGVLAGERIGYLDEVEGCYGVRPERVPEETFARAHERLEAVLPGRETLAERMEAWRERTTVPDEKLAEAFDAIAALMREATRRRFTLPKDESFALELVRDESWAAYNYYLGGLRSRIAVNLDRPISAAFLIDLVAHEAYPGHHTEHAAKEEALVTQGVVEEALLLVPTPQSIVSEGIAENAWDAVADDGLRRSVVEVLADLDIEYDMETAEAIAEAARDLRFVASNAALLLYEDGGTEDEAQMYIERWAATTPTRAASSRRFIVDPLWRAYVSTYSYGGALVRAHVAGRPERFGELLTQHVRIGDLLPISSAP